MKEFLSDNSVFIAIAAALFAMTSTILAFLNYFSRNKRSSRLYYEPLETFKILNNESTYFKGFSFQYKGEPINTNVINIIGKIKCKGKDINTENNQITITAPTGCKWLDISITQKGKSNADAYMSKNNRQEAILSFDKLRRNKSFTINALLDTSINTAYSAHKKIEFDHSIDDTDDIKIITNHTKFRNISYLAIASAIILILFIYAGMKQMTLMVAISIILIIILISCFIIISIIFKTD